MVLGWLWFALASNPAWAQSYAEEAEIQFQLGAQRYAAREYDDALASFLASYRLAPNASVAYNIGRCYTELGRFAEAFRWFNTAGQGTSSDQVKAAVDRELGGILPKVAVYEVTSEPPGASVYIDRKDLGVVGTTPFQVAVMPDGQSRTFLFEADGHVEGSVQMPSPVANRRDTVKAQLARIVGKVAITAPEGTEVHQGTPEGPLLCVAPCEAEMPPGTWLLHFRKEGYRDDARQIEVIRDGKVSVEVSPVPNTGSVVLDISERGALVEIDGQAVGFTPTVAQGVAVGQRTVRVSRSGYEAEERVVTVATDQSVVLSDIVLKPLNEVTAVSRRAEKVELAPSSVTIVSQEELKAFRYPNIYEALRGVRGLSLTYDSIYGSAAIRGLGQANDFGNRMLLLSDGATLNDPILYQSFIQYDGRVDLGGIERIEVVRGPGSVLYGTGAVSGVVNMVGAGLDSPDRVDVTAGSYQNGVVWGRAQAHTHFGDDTGLRASVSGAGSQGRTEGLPDGTVVEGFDRFRGGTTSGRFWHKDFTFQWFHTGRGVDIPTGVYGSVVGQLDGNTWIDQRTMGEARYEPKLSDKVTLFTRAFFNRYDYQYFADYGLLSGREHYIGTGAGGEARIIADFSEKFRLQTGVYGDGVPDIRLEGYDLGPGGTEFPYLDEERSYSILAAYALMDISPSEAVRLTAGGRADYWSTFGLAFSPRLALVLVPDEGDVVKVLGGRAFRAPSQYELYYNIPGIQETPDSQGISLEPETVWSGEVEYSHAFDDVWTGMISGHGSLADQLVETVEAPDVAGSATYANSDAAIRILGADLEVRRSFRSGWMFSSFYSLLDARYETGELTPNVPLHNAGFKSIIPVAGPLAKVAWRASLEAPRRIDDRNEDMTDWAVVSDVVLSGSVPERQFEYAVGVYNLFDMAYRQPTSTDLFPFRTMPQQGRSFMLNLGFWL